MGYDQVASVAKGTVPALPIQHPGSWSSRNCRSVRWQLAVAPSCWKSSGMSTVSCGHNQTPSTFRVTAPVTVLSAKKNGPYTLCYDNAQNIFTFGNLAAAWKKSLGSADPKCDSFQTHEKSFRHYKPRQTWYFHRLISYQETPHRSWTSFFVTVTCSLKELQSVFLYIENVSSVPDIQMWVASEAADQPYSRHSPPFLQRQPSSANFQYNSLIEFFEGASLTNLHRSATASNFIAS
jgi:hypothetical protein